MQNFEIFSFLFTIGCFSLADRSRTSEIQTCDDSMLTRCRLAKSTELSVVREDGILISNEYNFSMPEQIRQSHVD